MALHDYENVKIEQQDGITWVILNRPAKRNAMSPKLNNELKEKKPVTLRACKQGFKMCREMGWEQALDYLYAKIDQMRFWDTEDGSEKGMYQFLEEKSYKPGLGVYDKSKNSLPEKL